MILNFRIDKAVYKNSLPLKDNKRYNIISNLKSRFERLGICQNLISQGGDFQKLTTVR